MIFSLFLIFGIACANAASSSGDTKNAKICENKSGKITCPSNLKISIISTNYGRLAFSPCPRAGSNTNCRSTKWESTVKDLCDGKKECTLKPTNRFGDPCRGTYKYLEVKYSCVVNNRAEYTYTSVGCWRDTGVRAITPLNHYMPGYPYLRNQQLIDGCYKAAKSRGFKYFSLQATYWCASSEAAGKRYKQYEFRYQMYGKATNCNNEGTGGNWANAVYKIGPTITVNPPLVHAEANGDRIQFKSQFVRDAKITKPMTYEVTWYKKLPNGKDVLLKTDLPKGDFSVLQNSDDKKLFSIGDSIFTKTRAWLNEDVNSKTDPVSSNVYFAGIKFNRNSLKLKEGGATEKVEVTSTVPILCKDGSKKCKVTTRLVASGTGVQISKCTLTFEATAIVGTSHSITVVATRDFVDGVGGDLNIMLVIMPFPGSDWEGASPGPIIKVTTVDVSTGICISTGDPHFRTFDGQYHDLYLTGDFTYVVNEARKFEVQARTYRCIRQVACNCAIAAKEGNDVLVVDNCQGAPKVRYASNREPKRGTYISRSPNGRTFMLNFASGASIKFTNNNWYSDVTIQIPPDDYGTARGLCGKLDGDRGNDKDPRVPGQEYRNSWRVSTKDSLFNYDEGNMECLPTETNSFCQCTKGDDGSYGSKCGLNVKPPTIQKKLQSGFTRILFPGQAKCNEARKEKPDKGIPLPPTDPKDIYPYDPEPVDPNFKPTWPTKNGITEQQAKDHCKKKLEGSPLYKACKKAMGGKFNDQGFLKQCLADIKIMDDKDAAVQAATDAMKSECEEVTSRDTKTWETGKDGKKKPREDIADNMCPKQCNDRGKCTKGKCTCDKGFVGDDCSLQEGVPPLNVKIANGLCDLRKKQGCSSVKITAGNIIPGAVKCCEKGVGESGDATLFSFAEVSCAVPTKTKVVYQKGQSGTAVSNMKISLGNGDCKGLTTYAKFRVYDSKCMQCTDSTSPCTQKKNTCKINGYCFTDGEVDPSDAKKCTACDSSQSTDKFSPRPDKDLPDACKAHPCDMDNKGGCAQTCVKKAGREFECSCSKCYKVGADGKACVKLHPCEKAKKGGCGQVCTKTTGMKFKCDCNKGYVLKDDGKNCKKADCVSTYGGISAGACCEFPFKYGGKSHVACTTLGASVAWCYTAGGKWGYCKAKEECKSKVKTFGGSASGRCCKFPFTYNDKEYNACTKENANKPWCYSANGDWGYCKTGEEKKCKQKMYGGSSGDDCCAIPFTYGGTEHTKCTMEHASKPWCYNDDKKWGYCVVDEKKQECKQKMYGGTSGDDCCKIPFTYKGTVYKACTTTGDGTPWCYNTVKKWGYCTVDKNKEEEDCD